MKLCSISINVNQRSLFRFLSSSLFVLMILLTICSCKRNKEYLLETHSTYIENVVYKKSTLGFESVFPEGYRSNWIEDSVGDLGYRKHIILQNLKELENVNIEGAYQSEIENIFGPPNYVGTAIGDTWIRNLSYTITAEDSILSSDSVMVFEFLIDSFTNRAMCCMIRISGSGNYPKSQEIADGLIIPECDSILSVLVEDAYRDRTAYFNRHGKNLGIDKVEDVSLFNRELLLGLDQNKQFLNLGCVVEYLGHPDHFRLKIYSDERGVSQENIYLSTSNQKFTLTFKQGYLTRVSGFTF